MCIVVVARLFLEVKEDTENLGSVPVPASRIDGIHEIFEPKSPIDGGEVNDLEVFPFRQANSIRTVL